MIDTSNAEQQPKRISLGATHGKDNDFTIQFLKDQLKFVNERLKKATDELDDKENVISKLEHEKREI